MATKETKASLSFEEKRECGFRIIGKLYLIGGADAFPCDRLPLTLHECDACGHIPSFSRRYQRIDISTVFGGKHIIPMDDEICKDLKKHPDDILCDPTNPIHNDPEVKHFLMYVGKEYYTPEKFLEESKKQGISKAISTIPDGLVLGKSWIFLAFPQLAEEIEGITPVKGQMKIIKRDAIFHAFLSQRLEILVTQEQSVDAEFMKALTDYGITPVIVPKKDEEFHKTKVAVTYASKLYANWREKYAKNKKNDNTSGQSSTETESQKRVSLFDFIPSGKGDPLEVITKLEPKSFEEESEDEDEPEQIDDFDSEEDPDVVEEINPVLERTDDPNKSFSVEKLNEGEKLIYASIKESIIKIFDNVNLIASIDQFGSEFYQFLESGGWVKRMNDTTCELLEIVSDEAKKYFVDQVATFIHINMSKADGMHFYFPKKYPVAGTDTESKTKSNKKKTKKKEVVTGNPTEKQIMCNMCEIRALETDDEKETGYCTKCYAKIKAELHKSAQKKKEQDEEHKKDARMG